MFKFLILWIFIFGIVFLSGVLIGAKFKTQVDNIVSWVRRGFKKQ